MCVYSHRNEYLEPIKNNVKLVKYEKVLGELSDTSLEQVAPTPPPRNDANRINFTLKENENNSEKSSESDSLFNISINHSILSEKIGCNTSFRSGNVQILSGSIKNYEDGEEDTDSRGSNIEPLFTVNISVKNERNGVLIHRKIYL